MNNYMKKRMDNYMKKRVQASQEQLNVIFVANECDLYG